MASNGIAVHTIRARMTLCGLAILLAFAAPAYAGVVSAQEKIPAVRGAALDGHAVELPRDLRPATVLILGFSQGAQETTTAWEKRVRGELASASVGFYDMPVLAAIPGFVRGMVVRSIRKKVPAVLQPNFLPLNQDEGAWKQVAGYTKDAPDAAYVLLVDRDGNVRWRTHEPVGAAIFAQLSKQARMLTDTRP